MARAWFRFYEELNDFLAPERRKSSFEHVFDRRASVKDFIESFGVPHPEVELILVNGEPVGFGYIVGDGDRVSVYPVFESIDVFELVKLRPQPLRRMRFVLDVHLGVLARYLRLCGFDTLYRNDYEDEVLAQISAAQQRILLTREGALLKLKIVTHGYCVRRDKPREQLAEVVARFDLYRLIHPFRRCARCNGCLKDVPKSAIEHRLEPLTRRYYEHFTICDQCQRLYWRGSHFGPIQRLIASLARPTPMNP